MFRPALSLLTGPAGRGVQLLTAAAVSACLAVGLYSLAVLRAVPAHDLPSSYKWLLLEDTAHAPRIIIEGGSSGHHGIDTDAVSAALGVTAINIADNAGYDLIDKVARLQEFAHPGDTVVLQLEWSYYLRDSVTDDYLSVIFGALPDYFTTLSWPDKLRRAMSVPAPSLWAASHQAPPPASVLTAAQQLDIAALQGPSGHVSYDLARPAALGVEGQSCDSYLFSEALKQGRLTPSAMFLAALERLQTLQSQGVQVLFAWPIVAGDDCYTSDIGLMALHDQVQDAVLGKGFSFLGSMTDTLFPGDLRDDTPYHLITKGTARRTALLIDALRAQGVTGTGAFDLQSLAHAVIYGHELRQTDPATLTQMPMDAAFAMSGAAPDQMRFTAGWWQDEPSGRWMRGREAVLTLALAANLPVDRMLALSGFTFNGQARRIGVFFDGHALGQGDVAGEFTLSVPLTDVPRNRPVRLTLRLLDDAPLQSPSELGQGDDIRSLSLHLRSLSLAPPAPPVTLAGETLALPAIQPTTACASVAGAPLCQSPPAVSGDTALTEVLPSARLALTEDAVGNQMRLSGGWWGGEAGGRWIGARDAGITLRLAAGQLPVGLRLHARPFHMDVQPVEITVAGKSVFKGELLADQPISFTLPAAMAGQEVTLMLHFPTAEVRCPTSLGLGDDTRSLIAFVSAIETFVPAASG